MESLSIGGVSYLALDDLNSIAFISLWEKLGRVYMLSPECVIRSLNCAYKGSATFVILPHNIPAIFPFLRLWLIIAISNR